MAWCRHSVNAVKLLASRNVQILRVPEPRCIKRWVAPTLRELYRRREKVGPPPPQHRSTYLEWNYDAELFAFGKRLGEQFDEQLLRQALTHASYVTQQQTEHAIPDNKQLIQAGEALISSYLNAELKKTQPDVLVQVVHDHLTSVEMLAKVACLIGVKDIVLCADFPVEPSTLADTFKALVACLEASTSRDRAESFVHDFLLTQLTGQDVYDIWNLQQPYEYLKHQLKGREIEPRLCNQSAANTILASYQVGLYSDKTLLGIGFGESIETAKNTAALDAIQRLHALRRSSPAN